MRLQKKAAINFIIDQLSNLKNTEIKIEKKWIKSVNLLKHIKCFNICEIVSKREKKEVETMLKMVIAKNSQICLKYILRYMWKDVEVWVIPPKNVDLISRIHECVNLHGKRDFAEVLELRILICEDYFALLRE